MKEFFEKVKSGVGKAVGGAEKYSKIAVQKTNDVISKTKLNISLNETENKIVSVLAEIGEFVYSEYKEGSEFPEDIAAKCAEIDNYKAEITVLKDKIAEIKDAVCCSECGEYNPEESNFCSKCGKSLK